MLPFRAFAGAAVEVSQPNTPEVSAEASTCRAGRGV